MRISDWSSDVCSSDLAVFTFPVPLDAAFVGLRATIAGETLCAQIQAKRQASETYGDAIAQGHSAVLLSAPEPGVLCTSLGNLKPGERSEEHTSELQSLMRISYAVFCLKKKQ